MMMRTVCRNLSRLSLLAMALSTFALPISHAGLWIVPEPASAAANQEIAIRLFEGQPFQGEERTYRPAKGIRFQRLWKKGRENLSAAAFRPAEAGVQLIGYSSPATGNFCKLLTIVGDAAENDPLRWSELGQRLEIVPQSDPVILLRNGGMLQVQVLFEREPLADVRVFALPQAAPVEGRKPERTDEIGLVSFRLDRPGLWMIMVEQAEMSATLVLRAGPESE
jgi:hypothetical protein